MGWKSMSLLLWRNVDIALLGEERKIGLSWGAWVAQSVKRSTSAQVIILQFMSLRPLLGSGLTVWSLEPASGSVSPSLSAPPLLTLFLSLKNE